ncbi:glycoside hydrolase family 73 protein [Fructilactobacillus fructivorans]|uniref:glycoside hydrolase family 73 protein n=1 Tax=Fructilactobacillus fructivorans TaxID=1614 RepID=UPI000704F85A
MLSVKHNKKKNIWIAIVIGIVVVLLLVFAAFKVRHMLINHSYQVRQEQMNNDTKKREKEIETQHKEFIQKIGDPAVKIYEKKQQVLPSIVIGQAILESNWGQSELYKKANNPFGIKGTYNGQSISYDTTEYVNNKKTTEVGQFRKYPSVADAIEDHNETLNTKFLKKTGITSFRQEANLLQKNGYATDPDYANKLIGVIVNHKLMKYDVKAINNY